MLTNEKIIEKQKEKVAQLTRIIFDLDCTVDRTYYLGLKSGTGLRTYLNSLPKNEAIEFEIYAHLRNTLFGFDSIDTGPRELLFLFEDRINVNDLYFVDPKFLGPYEKTYPEHVKRCVIGKMPILYHKRPTDADNIYLAGVGCMHDTSKYEQVYYGKTIVLLYRIDYNTEDTYKDPPSDSYSDYVFFVHQYDELCLDFLNLIEQKINNVLNVMNVIKKD